MYYQDILVNTIGAAKQKDYKGYSKFDALNSRFLNYLSFRSGFLRLFFIQGVNRLPVNIRPLFGVEKTRNPKGIALFIRAFLSLYERTGEQYFLNEAEYLIDWLVKNSSTGERNLCWGYNFIWQSPNFVQKKNEPNAVVTAFAGESLVHAFRVTGKQEYLDYARSSVEFILNDLPVLHETPQERAIAYVKRPVKGVVLNNQVLTAALIMKVWKHTREEQLLEIANRQLNYTLNRRTEYDCWYYSYPANLSRITHDNYHTGGILDGILECYEETDDSRFMDVYWSGLDFYRQNLFETDGAPRWMNNKKYPYDIHGSAQGIITFKKASKHNEEYVNLSHSIADWALKNLYRDSSMDFIYRKGRLLRWNYSLMRWCNAWMTRALSELISQD